MQSILVVLFNVLEIEYVIFYSFVPTFKSMFKFCCVSVLIIPDCQIIIAFSSCAFDIMVLSMISRGVHKNIFFCSWQRVTAAEAL